MATLKGLLEQRDQRDNQIELFKAKMLAVEGQLKTNELKMRQLEKHTAGLKASIESTQLKIEKAQAERDELSRQIETWQGN